MIKCTHLIHMKKKTKNETDRYFVIAIDNADKRTKFIIGEGMTYALGFWASTVPLSIEVEEAKILEVWIPNNNIDHVESLVYRQRN